MGEIFTRLAMENNEGKEEIILVEIDDLLEFRGHPFQVRDDEEMEKLTESIRECGILNPILAFHNEDGETEIISGHRRVHAARKLGFSTVPVKMSANRMLEEWISSGRTEGNPEDICPFPLFDRLPEVTCSDCPDTLSSPRGTDKTGSVY